MDLCLCELSLYVCKRGKGMSDHAKREGHVMYNALDIWVIHPEL